jgi:hypothetical protein
MAREMMKDEPNIGVVLCYRLGHIAVLDPKAARVPISLAVKNGAPHPDISSVEAFKRTLLDARSSPTSTQRAAAPAASSWRRPSKSSASPPN